MTSGSEVRSKRSPKPWIVMFVALLVVGLAEPSHRFLERRYPAAHAPAAGTGGEAPGAAEAGHQGSESDGFLALFFYTVEHLAAVVFVAMIIRVAIEEAAQKQAVAELSTAVREKLDEAFHSVDETVGRFEQQVEQVERELHSIEVLTGGNLYGKRLQFSDKEEISRVFLNPVFFRPGYKLDLTLTPKGQEIVELCIRTDALLENISPDRQPYSVTALLDNVLFNSGTTSFSRSAKFDRFEFGPDTEAGRRRASLQPFDLKRYTIEELKHAGYLADVGTDLAFAYTPGEEIPPGEVYFIKMTGTQQMRESDLLLWYMFTATQNLELTVHLEGGLTTDNFTVITRPIHHKDHAVFVPAISEDKTVLTWVVDGILLPYQGLTVWWSRGSS